MTKKSLVMLGSALAIGIIAAAPLPALAQGANPCAPKAQSNSATKGKAATKAANPCAKPANPCAPKAGNPCAPKAGNPCAPKK